VDTVGWRNGIRAMLLWADSASAMAIDNVTLVGGDRYFHD